MDSVILALATVSGFVIGWSVSAMVAERTVNRRLFASLRVAALQLESVVRGVEGGSMSPVVGDMIGTVTASIGVMASAKTLISEFGARLQAGVDAALASGATAEQLEPLVSLRQELETESNALAAAVAANS